METKAPFTRSAARRFRPIFRTASMALLLAAVVTGCVSRYDIVLRSGNYTTTKGKPKLDERGYWNYTDVEGNPGRVSDSQVREIAPHSDRTDTKGKGFFSPSK